jgi:hypothetical protein
MVNSKMYVVEVQERKPVGLEYAVEFHSKQMAELYAAYARGKGMVVDVIPAGDGHTAAVGNKELKTAYEGV